ncbi:MAG: AbrB/MazE/SpoVT family DNA-binding domain-containing protein [Gammaproteobacteria bacterium]|nr:AbrB/MazE/SpoVT family DNA-binding domain-containing protein [Gammaproteobacteria bacterium]
MAHLIKIGNSHGVRIPKPLIEQAKLKGKELKLELVGDGLLIRPEKKARDGWQAAIEGVIAVQGQEELDSEWLDLPLSTDDELEW